MINDVTYLMDESLSELAQIYNIQQEMANRAAWGALPLQQRREREGTLHSLERQATSYTQLGNSTVDMLKLFTAETKEPFMMPEIVHKLAAMLDYNLDALVGPRCNELRVENKDKYHFNPRQLLSDVVQVYLNLGDQNEFVRAVAGDGRSYRKELFDSAANKCSKNSLKSPTEVEQLRLFVAKVEEARITLEVEEDLGEIPDEFLGASVSFAMPTVVPIYSRSSSRPIDVHHHARPSDPTHFASCSRPVNNQVTSPLGCDRSFQSQTVNHRGSHPWWVLSEVGSAVLSFIRLPPSQILSSRNGSKPSS
jgi:ubiquitin conjugation factor E4 B